MTQEDALQDIMFFKEAAVDAFNLQHDTRFNYHDFDIYSIAPNQNSDFAYRLITTRKDDFLVLENHCHVGPYTRFYPYEDVSYQENIPDANGSIFLSYAMVDKLYPIVTKVILTESGNHAILSQQNILLTPEN